MIGDEPHLRGGRHRLSDGYDAPTEEIRLPQGELEDIHVYEPSDPRFKRHVVHDRRSRAYALTATATPRRTVAWPRQGPIFDQNTYDNRQGGVGVGCCTACAGLGLLMTSPFDRGRDFTPDEVLDLYHEETVEDERDIPGVWPPEDTGSAGIYLMRVLKRRGLITAYRHAFSVNAALAALQRGPIAVGSVWLASMDEPRRGTIRVDKRTQVLGGHEYVVDAYHEQGYVRVTNSWGEHWGTSGSAWLTVADFDWLLRQQGDVVQPVVA